MSFGFGGGVGEGGKALGVGGGIGEGGIGSGDGAGTGSGGIGCGGNGSTSGDRVMASDSARQWSDMRSANTNWAVTTADKPHILLQVLIGQLALQVRKSDIVKSSEDKLSTALPLPNRRGRPLGSRRLHQNPLPSPRLTIFCSASSQSSKSCPSSRPRCSYSKYAKAAILVLSFPVMA